MADDYTQYLQLQLQYGSAASEAMFDFPCHFFQTPGCIGTIAYRLEHQCAVIFGDPICPPKEVQPLTEAFHEQCRTLNLNIIYIIASAKFAAWAKRSLCRIAIAVCEEQIFDPAFDPSQKHNKLKHKIDRAIKHGLTVHEYVPLNPDIEKSLAHVGAKWLQAIKGPHIHLGYLNFFENRAGSRWFYVKDGEHITSMAMLRRLESQKGWLLKFLVTLPDAFRGTSEFLMSSVLKVLREENCHFFTRGMSPVDTLEEIEGLGVFSRSAAKTIYKLVRWFFQFEKRKEYWLKFDPKCAPAYLLIARPHIGLNEIRALMKAFKVDR